MMKLLVEAMVKGLVDDEAAVLVVEARAGHSVLFEVTTSPLDFGKVLGRGGETVKAIRFILKNVGLKHGLNVQLDVVDPMKREKKGAAEGSGT